MAQFAFAYLAFMTLHIVPAATGLRGLAIRTIGRGGYISIYSLTSVLLLIWLVAAARSAPTLALWPLTPDLVWIPLVVMPLALFLVVGGLATPNPLSISWRGEGFDRSNPGIVAITRHPVLWGLLLWALCHGAVNGDLVSVALFGGLALYAAFGLGRADERARERLGAERWAALSAGTGSVPFAVILSGCQRLPTDMPTFATGFLTFGIYTALLAGGHFWLFGVDPLALLGW